MLNDGKRHKIHGLSETVDNGNESPQVGLETSHQEANPFNLPNREITIDCPFRLWV